MAETGDWTQALTAGLTNLLQKLLEYMPQVLAAVLLLLVGWLVAHLLRVVTIRLVVALAAWLPRLVPAEIRDKVWVRRLSPRLIGGIVFWAVILAFLTAATHVLQLVVFSAWLNTVLSYVPLMLLAALIVVVGVVLGQLARDAAVGAAAAAGLEYRGFIGFATQATILAAALVIGLELIGLDITFLTVIAAILISAVAGSVALAFGLGAQTQVSNLLGARQLPQHYRVGDVIRIGEYEGQVIEITPRSVILETEEGRTIVPARYFSEYACTALVREDTDV